MERSGESVTRLSYQYSETVSNKGRGERKGEHECGARTIRIWRGKKKKRIAVALS